MLQQPISREYAQLLLGVPVRMLLQDGSERIGVLTSVKGNRIILNETAEDFGRSGRASNGGRTAKTSRKGGAKTRTVNSEELPTVFPYPVQPYFGPKTVVELNSIQILVPFMP